MLCLQGCGLQILGRAGGTHSSESASISQGWGLADSPSPHALRHQSGQAADPPHSGTMLFAVRKWFFHTQTRIETWKRPKHQDSNRNGRTAYCPTPSPREGGTSGPALCPPIWAECGGALGPAPVRTPAAGLQGRTRAPRPGQEDGGERAGAEAGAALQAGDRHRTGHPAAAGPGGVELQWPGGGRARRGAPTAVRAGRPGAGARGVLAGLRAAPARQVGHGPCASKAQAASWSPASGPQRSLHWRAWLAA